MILVLNFGLVRKKAIFLIQTIEIFVMHFCGIKLHQRTASHIAIRNSFFFYLGLFITDNHTKCCTCSYVFRPSEDQWSGYLTNHLDP